MKILHHQIPMQLRTVHGESRRRTRDPSGIEPGSLGQGANSLPILPYCSPGIRRIRSTVSLCIPAGVHGATLQQVVIPWLRAWLPVFCKRF